MDQTQENGRVIITDRQAWALLDLMEDFYRDPKNREAYEQWKAERENTAP